MSEADNIIEQMDVIQQKGLHDLNQVKNEAELQAWKVTYLGRGSRVMQVFSSLPGLAKEDRPLVGQHANLVKQALEDGYNHQNQAIKESALQQSLEKDRLDVTLPGRRLRWSFSTPGGRGAWPIPSETTRSSFPRRAPWPGKRCCSAGNCSRCLARRWHGRPASHCCPPG